MRNRSAAKRAASSPPVPARISMITSRSSFGSRGTSSTLSSASSCASRASRASTSSRTSARTSSSGSWAISRVALSSSRTAFQARMAVDHRLQPGQLAAQVAQARRVRRRRRATPSAPSAPRSAPRSRAVGQSRLHYRVTDRAGVAEPEDAARGCQISSAVAVVRTDPAFRRPGPGCLTQRVPGPGTSQRISAVRAGWPSPTHRDPTPGRTPARRCSPRACRGPAAGW